VDDCDAAAARAESLGGKLLMPAMDIPGVGRFAVLFDPQGAEFAVIRLTLGGALIPARPSQLAVTAVSQE